MQDIVPAIDGLIKHETQLYDTFHAFMETCKSSPELYRGIQEDLQEVERPGERSALMDHYLEKLTTVGRPVILRGLAKRPALNGAEATIMGPHSNGRVPVKPVGQEATIRVRVVNLRPANRRATGRETMLYEMSRNTSFGQSPDLSGLDDAVRGMEEAVLEAVRERHGEDVDPEAAMASQLLHKVATAPSDLLETVQEDEADGHQISSTGIVGAAVRSARFLTRRDREPTRGTLLQIEGLAAAKREAVACLFALTMPGADLPTTAPPPAGMQDELASRFDGASTVTAVRQKLRAEILTISEHAATGRSRQRQETDGGDGDGAPSPQAEVAAAPGKNSAKNRRKREKAKAKRLEGEGSAAATEAEPAVATMDASQPPDDYICPITQDVMIDPVIATDGHTYERAAIAKWFEGGKRTSPKTGEELKATTLLPNHLVRRLIIEWHENHSSRAQDN